MNILHGWTGAEGKEYVGAVPGVDSPNIPRTGQNGIPPNAQSSPYH